MDEVSELTNIQEGIKARMAQMDEVIEKMRVQKEMIESFLAQEPKYQELLKVSQKANKDKNAVKASLLKTPQVANNVETLRSLKEQQSELKEGLSYFLREYQRLTGANEFEGSDGELRSIVYIAKLVRKSQFKK